MPSFGPRVEGYTVPVWKYINLVEDCGLGLIGCRPGGGGAGGGCGSLAGE